MVSRTQREMAAEQQSITQRQHDLKKEASPPKNKAPDNTAQIVLLVLFTGYRMRITGVQLTTNSSNKLSSTQKLEYENNLQALYLKNTVADQAWLRRNCNS